MSTGSNPKVTGTNTSGLYGSTGTVTVSNSTYGNADVAAFLQSYTGNLQAGNANIIGNLAAGGVLTDNYYYANGAPVSFSGTYGNANVAAYLPTYTGNLAGGNAAITGAITVATVSASGNITGNYILGNGSQLTGLPSSYGNANVAAYLPTYTGNLQAGNLETINDANINNDLYVGGTIYGTFSGNISGNLVVPGANTEVIYNDAGNAGASSDFTYNDGTKTLTVQNGLQYVSVSSGNITASDNIYASGNLSTSEITASGNIVLTGSSERRISSQDDLRIYASAGKKLNLQNPSIEMANIDMRAANITMSSVSGATNANITGTLGVSGNITGDIVTGSSSIRGGSALFSTAGSNVAVTLYPSRSDIIAQDTSGNNITNVTSQYITTNGYISAAGNVTGSNIIGNGQYLTNLPGANVTGTVANATYATSAGSATTATHATTANTVTDAAQANITSVGTLTGLTVGGDQDITGNLIVGQNLTVNGNTISVNISELNVEDPIIGLGRGANNTPLTSNDGKDRGEQLWYYSGSEKSAFTGYDNSAGNVILATDVTIANEIVSVNSWGTTETGDLLAHGDVNAGNVTATGVVYTPQVESNTTLDLNTPNGINANGNLRVGDNNTDTQIATHGTGDLILRTHAGSASEGNIHLYDGANGNIDVNPNGTGKINLNAGVLTSDGITATGNITANTFVGQLNGNVIQPLQFGIEAIGNPTNSTSVYGNGVGIQSYTDQDINILSTTTNSHINMVTFGSGVAADINIGALGNATANVRIRNADLNAEQDITATGNITGAYFIGDGSQLTNLPAGTYGNANVANFLATGFGSNTITTTGNVSFGNINVTGIVSSNTGAVKIEDDVYLGSAARPVIISGSSGTFSANAYIGSIAANIFNGDTSGSGLKIQAADAAAKVLDLYNVYGVSAGNIDAGGGLQLAGTVQAASTIKAGAVTYTATDGTAGQVLTTYGNGITYFSTVSGSLAGNMTGNINGQGYNIGNLSNVSIANSGNLSIGSVLFTNNQVSPAGLVIDGSVEIKDITVFNGDLKIQDSNGVNFYDADNTNYVGLKGPAVVASDIEWTLPAADGTSAQALSTYGNGQLYWQSVGSGSLSGNMTGNISGVNLYNISGLTSLSASSVATDTISSPSGDFVTIEGVVATNGGTMSGNLGLTNQKAIAFYELTANGNSAVVFRAPEALSQDYIYQLPNSYGSNTQVLTTDGTGNLSWSTASGGGGTPGGSDSQIQYNNGGSFGGYATFTLNDTTGDVAMGNIVFASNNTSSSTTYDLYSNWIKNQNNYLGNTATATSYAPGRYLLGRGVGGAPGSGGDPGAFGTAILDNNSRNSRILLADRYTRTDNGVRNTSFAIENWIDFSGNVGTSNNNSRTQGIVSTMYIGGNGTGNSVSQSVSFVRGISSTMNLGTSGSANVGNIVVGGMSQFNSFNDVRPGASVGNNVAYLAGCQNNSGNAANLNHYIGFTTSSGGNAAPTTLSLVYLANSSVAVSGTGVNTTYTPTNYYFLNNTDLRSTSKTGPLSEYFDRPYTFTTTTGSTNLDWTNGTSQYLKPTGNVTLSFTGATTNTNGNLFHTVTLVVEQGTTPYTITLPAASSTVKYAGGVSTVGVTANAVIMITSTAANINGSTTYLTTVSPEFI